jgi:hypothetical protein
MDKRNLLAKSLFALCVHLVNKNHHRNTTGLVFDDIGLGNDVCEDVVVNFSAL